MALPLGLGATVLAATVLALAFFTPLSASVAYGLSLALGLVVAALTRRLTRKRGARSLGRKTCDLTTRKERTVMKPLLSLLLVALVAGVAYAQDCSGTLVSHEVGDTCVPSVPERIVALEYSYIDHLGKLGVAPVGYARDAMPEYLEPFSEGAGATAVGTRAEPNLEAIVALDPDLIIADLHRHEAIYQQLSAIAPTVVFNSLRGSYRDQLGAFGDIARILEREDEAAAMLSDYQEQFDAAKAQTDPEAGTFVVGVLHPGGFTAHSSESFMGSFLESLGRKNALAPREGESQFLIDLEGLAAINPSSIVIMCNPENQELLEDWQANPLWRAFDAVQRGHVYVFNQNLWSKGRGLMAFEQILDDASTSGLLAERPNEGWQCR